VLNSIFNISVLEQRQKINKIYGLGFFLVIILLSFLIDPMKQGLLGCYFLEATGHNCPTCGMSRSFFSMAQANFISAFEFHYFGPLLYVFFIIMVIKFAGEIIMNKNITIKKNLIPHKIVFLVFSLTWLTVWILKEFS